MNAKKIKPGTEVWTLHRVEDYGWVVDRGIAKKYDLIDYLHVQYKHAETGYEYTSHIPQSEAFKDVDDAKDEAIKRNRLMISEHLKIVKCLRKNLRQLAKRECFAHGMQSPKHFETCDHGL